LREADCFAETCCAGRAKDEGHVILVVDFDDGAGKVKMLATVALTLKKIFSPKLRLLSGALQKAVDIPHASNLFSHRYHHRVQVEFVQARSHTQIIVSFAEYQLWLGYTKHMLDFVCWKIMIEGQ
jgi:hypothetical protein